MNSTANPSSLRVLMVSTDASALVQGSGTQQRLAAYAERLASLTVLVIGARGARFAEGNLVVEAVPGSRLMRTWAIARAVREKLATAPFDIVSSQDPFETGLGALRGIRRARAADAEGVPLHVQVHTDFLSPWYARESFKNRIRVRIANRVLPRAKGIRVVSERVKDSLVARYGSRIVEPSVIPVSVPLPNEQNVSLPPIRSSTNHFAFIIVSRFEREKRIGDVLEAFARVHARHPEVLLYLVGDGREKQALMALAKSLGINDSIAWLGWRTDTPGLMRSAGAFVQASSYEGYGMSLIEAALARLPIVTTDVGIVGSVLTDGKDALVVPVADVSALATAMTRIIEDAALRVALGSEAAHTARNHLMANMAQPDEVAGDLARAALV